MTDESDTGPTLGEVMLRALLTEERRNVIAGEAYVFLENAEGILEQKEMKAGDHFTVRPLQKHRIFAMTDLVLLEVSTPQVKDVVRIQDDAGRGDGRIEGEHREK